MKPFIISCILAILVGCATAPKPTVWYVRGTNWMIAAETKQIEVHTLKAPSFYDEVHDVDRDVYILRLVNKTDEPQCVKLSLREMDYFAHFPNRQWIWIGPEEQLKLGSVVQKVLMLQRQSVVLDDAKWVVDIEQTAKPAEEGCYDYTQ